MTMAGVMPEMRCRRRASSRGPAPGSGGGNGGGAAADGPPAQPAAEQEPAPAVADTAAGDASGQSSQHTHPQPDPAAATAEAERRLRRLRRFARLCTSLFGPGAVPLSKEQLQSASAADIGAALTAGLGPDVLGDLQVGRRAHWGMHGGTKQCLLAACGLHAAMGPRPRGPAPQPGAAAALASVLRRTTATSASAWQACWPPPRGGR